MLGPHMDSFHTLTHFFPARSQRYSIPLIFFHPTFKKNTRELLVCLNSAQWPCLWR
uniref:Uncharacterized protein n=1 Tax=Anguilla anguilla TaxID=7936 RepID=A0A0E9WZL8_ANGAN